MKILLLGDYSNVHCTLAEGFKALGHECVVASDGDHWKDYPRDIDLKREFGWKGNTSFLYRLMKALPKFRGFDVVQLINPVFIELKAERIAPFYKYIRRHNGKVVMGAFGMDYYWAKVNTDIRPLRYSDFNIGDQIRHDEAAEVFRRDMIGTPKETLCKLVAEDCDGIVAGLYEYWATYNAVSELRDKTVFIPFPINRPTPQQTPSPTLPLYGEGDRPDGSPHRGGDTPKGERGSVGSVRLFIGIAPDRSAYKGTDILLAAAKALQQKYPDKVELKIAEGVPFVTH